MGDVMREAYKRGWITTRDGNCSLRRSGTDILYITPSAVRKATIIPETIVRIPIHDNKLILDGLNPSGELEMHWKLQQKFRHSTKAVLHLHPTYTIAAMRAGWNLRELAEEFPEVHRYTKVGNRVHVTFYFQLSSKGSSSGQARIGGLPFTSANITNFYQHGSVWINTWNGGNTVPTGYVVPNTTSFRLERQIASSSTGVNTFDNTNMNNATDVMLSLHYQVS